MSSCGIVPPWNQEICVGDSTGESLVIKAEAGIATEENDPNNHSSRARQTSISVDDSEARSCVQCKTVMLFAGEAYNKLTWSTPTWEACQQLFHTPCRCDSCPLEPLCQFCHHLRLRHCVLCVPSDIDFPFLILLGTGEDILERLRLEPRCLLCQLAESFAAEHLDEKILIELDHRYLTTENGPGSLVLRSFGRTNARKRVHIGHFRCGKICNRTADQQPSTCAEADINCEAVSPNFKSRRIDWGLARQWIADCRLHHPQCTPKPDARGFKFRLVDTFDRKVVHAGISDHEFVAMSYVWGDVMNGSKLIARNSNIEDLYAPGSLQSECLPVTVEDAIVSCRHLGERFLWVDVLCIVQDNQADKHEQIKAMAKIYTEAVFVLIVASGDNMDTPIPGVSQDRVPPPERVDFPWDGMAATKWQTRGWTYQESILPTRKLYLMKNQIWFECSKTIIYESLSPSYYRGERIWHKMWGDPAEWVGTLLNGLDSPWDAYQRHLYAYSVLSLGRDADILDAFSGIIQSLYGPDSATFGLPLADFDRALLWSVYKSPVSENKYRHNIRATDDTIIPSWTWASITGRIVIEQRWSTHYIQGSLVNWLEYDQTNDSFRSVTARTELEAWRRRSSIEKSAPAVMALAWSQGCIEAKFLMKFDVDHFKFSELEPEAELRWRSYEDFQRDAFGSIPSPCHKTQGILFGRVQSATLALTMKSDLGLRRKEGFILGRQGEHVGTQRRFEPRFEQEVEARLKDGPVSGEFIALSISNQMLCSYELRDVVSSEARWEIEQNMEWLAGDDPDMQLPVVIEHEYTFVDSDGQLFIDSTGYVQTVNVMLIGTDDEGYSYRLGIGQVLLSKWVKAERCFKDIVLR